jgi:hypothetical protein
MEILFTNLARIEAFEYTVLIPCELERVSSYFNCATIENLKVFQIHSSDLERSNLEDCHASIEGTASITPFPPTYKAVAPCSEN